MKKLLVMLIVAMLVSGCQFAKSKNTFMLTKDQQNYALYDTKGNDLTDFSYKEYEKIDGIGYFVTNKEEQKGLISLQGKPIIACGDYATLEREGYLFYGTKDVEEVVDENEPNVLFEVKLFNRANGALAITVNGDVKGEFVVKAGDQSDTIEKKSFNKSASTILNTGKGTHQVVVKGKNISSSDGNSNKEIVLKGKIKVTKNGKQSSVYLKSMKEKTEEEKELEKYQSSNLYVIDCKGQVLYSANENQMIKSEGLPVIKSKEGYKVIGRNGDELYNGSDIVYYTGSYDYGSFVGFKDKVVYHYVDKEDNKTLKQLEIDYNGQLTLENGNERYCVLYDSKQKKTIVVDMLKHKYIYVALNIDESYLDKANNLIIESNGYKYTYDPVLVTLVKLESFYQNGSIYAKKNTNILGPHSFYKGSKVVGEVEGCQIYPAAYLVYSDIVPVYLQDEGYVFYNFEGKQVIDTIYLEANPFDDCHSAIVKVDDKGYSLIDEQGQILTKESYSLIKYLGQGYYAIYNEVGMFGIIDYKGTVIFDIQFTSLSKTPIIKNDDYFFMIMNKNGRSYVYDMKKEQNELFSVEGDMEYFDEGYFKTQYRYFDIHGEEIK